MINIIKLLKKNKYKIIVIGLIIFFIAFFGMWNVVSGGYDKQNKTILLLKKIIPTKIARKVRDTIFIIPDLKERNRFLELVMRKNDQGLNGEIFNNKIIVSKENHTEYLLKEFFIPFKRLDSRLGWASSKNTIRKHYLEIVKDKVVLISGEGQTIYFDKKNIFKDKLNQINIPNNLNKILDINKFEPMGIRDLLIEDEKVYVSLYFKNSKGYSVNIYAANLNYNKLNFELFFESNEFWKKYTVRTGGRIEKYKNNKILFTIGDGSIKKAAQNLNSLLGKIISIDKTSGAHKIISTGHRNPQGLLYDKELDVIINSEHGPKGGDEININFQNLNEIPNYGWDISSYGIEYNGDDIYKKSHSQFGFIEPFKYYNPSIGISEIALINNEDMKNEKYIITSSLRAGSIYLIKTDQKINKILNEDRIFFPQQRIRDLKYDEENHMFFLLFESIPSLGILSLDTK
tara:strand:+ start:6561 stop:7937 length:1377 start_codon:yes stop_codon:yes gene_type:complete